MAARRLNFTKLFFAVDLSATSTEAALVVGWTERTNATPVSNMGTASPTLGNGSAESADGMSIHASFPTIHLANVGDKVTLGGMATLSGISVSANQFRWGLYDLNGSSSDTGWLGYFATNGHNTIGSPLVERLNPNTGWYMQTGAGNSSTIATAAAPGVAFSDGTYSFSLSLERTVAGIQVSSSIIRQSSTRIKSSSPTSM